MKINQLASRRNHELAWRQITPGGDYQHKSLYRGIYFAYEVAPDANLRDLPQRLQGGAFEACHPERIYLPKVLGLHRLRALFIVGVRVR
jgi:hypothetical protein